MPIAEDSCPCLPVPSSTTAISRLSDSQTHMRPLAIKTGKTLRSLDTIDKLFERAFAPRISISSADGPSAKRRSVDQRRPMAPEPPDTSYDSPLDPPAQTTPKISLDPIWDEVRQTKERELAASPSKVKSLDRVMPPAPEPHVKSELPPPKKVVKRKSRQVDRGICLYDNLPRLQCSTASASKKLLTVSQ